MSDLDGQEREKLTEPQMRALRVIDAGDCWQKRARGVNLVRLDVLNRLMKRGYVTWERQFGMPADLTGKAYLTDRGREVLYG